MADYAIGDVQGCYDALLRLLESISFNDRVDKLWFVGDLVNRGPESLAVLRFIQQLPIQPYITLGNHDLHLLSQIYSTSKRTNVDDTLRAILKAPDRDEIGDWLRHQSILIHDARFNMVMTHAGISPQFTLQQAKSAALELEEVLASDDFVDFLSQMYGNLPDQWDEHLTGIDRLRYICNAFTRMRFCDAQGRLVLSYKGTINHAPAGLYPWFNTPHRHPIEVDIVFGHWAALEGKSLNPHIHALDTGCLWKGSLTALRLQDKKRFSCQCS